YAHAHGVVHRDIKPENVLLSGGVAVVADFGVAKAIAAAAGGSPRVDAPAGLTGAGLTGAGSALGTPAYMAPEQVIGDPGADQRADLYSLGCLAYELPAGRPPFTGDAPWRVARAQLQQVPEPVARYRLDTPPALAALVMQCLEKEPGARPASAGAVLAALDRPPAAPSPAPPPTARPPGRGPPWLRRTSTRVAALAVGLVVAGGGVATRVPTQLRATLATLLTRPGATLNPRRVVVAPLDNRTGDSSLTALGAMAADQVAQELMRTGEFEVVDPHTAATTGAVLARVPRPLREDDPAVALAKETGAGRVVTGSIDRVGDDLRLQAQLVDVASGRLLRAVPAVTGSARAPGAAVIALARRAVAELATTVDTAAGAGAAAVGRPPSYEAYREVSRAVESWFRSDRKDHDVRLARAAALDSTYALPLLLAAWAAEDEGRWANADSLVRRVARLDTLLTPTERDERDLLANGLAGDRPGQRRAGQALLARSPGSAEVALVVAQSAVSIDRPAIALAALDGTDPERGLNL
ncbi:MAG TPA: serine/threonine-protein kinase, partial [Gemmatirosa sp.]